MEVTLLDTEREDAVESSISFRLTLLWNTPTRMIAVIHGLTVAIELIRYDMPVDGDPEVKIRIHRTRDDPQAHIPGQTAVGAVVTGGL
jgi:hypothetical protein